MATLSMELTIRRNRFHVYALYCAHLRHPNSGYDPSHLEMILRKAIVGRRAIFHESRKVMVVHQTPPDHAVEDVHRIKLVRANGLSHAPVLSGNASATVDLILVKTPNRTKILCPSLIDFSMARPSASMSMHLTHHGISSGEARPNPSTEHGLEVAHLYLHLHLRPRAKTTKQASKCNIRPQKSKLRKKRKAPTKGLGEEF